jgi:hypothetical protein
MLMHDDELLSAIQTKLALGRLAWIDIDNPITADLVFTLAKQLSALIDVSQSFISPTHTTIVLTPACGATKH